MTSAAPTVARFKPGVLDAVMALGDQFAGARLTVVPGDETLESQRDDGVIKFWTRWHFDAHEEPSIAPSIASEVIYLPKVQPGTLRCTYEQTEDKDRLSVPAILGALPQVDGLRWIIGNAPTVNRVLANHLEATDGKEYLLRGEYTWTTDSYESLYGPAHLLVGYFHEYGVEVTFLRPFPCHDHAWVFALGVPA